MQCMALCLAHFAHLPPSNPRSCRAVPCRSPLREVVYAIRSIMPLFVALSFLILAVLRMPLPECSIWLETPEEVGDDVSVRSATANKPRDALSRASMAIVSGLQRSASQSTLGDDSSREGTEHDGQAAADALAAATAADVEAGGAKGPAPAKAAVVPPGEVQVKAPAETGLGRWLVRNAPLLAGAAVCQMGMIAFNIGLTYGFTALGNQTGSTLPAAFLTVPYDPDSPYYSYAGGLILVLVTVFLLGVLATRAEPALNVLGCTVERLSGGAFTSKMLIGAVCVGVGTGMAVGAVKILFSLPILYFILGKYAVACALTFITADAITAVAWDSAGVTTGPVTVPFVLAIGIGFSQAVGSTEGFGMLTIASVAPIISVLTTSLLRKPAAAARRQLSQRARSLARSVSQRSFNTGGGRRVMLSPSFAMAAFAADAGASAGPTPEPSLRGGQALYSGTAGDGGGNV